MSRIVLGALVVLAFAAPAQAVTTVVGPGNLGSGGDASGCDTQGCERTWVNLSLPAGAGTLAVPYDGRITGWRTRGAHWGGYVRLRAVTPGPQAGQYTSRWVSPDGPVAEQTGATIGLPTPLAVEHGDLLGLTGSYFFPYFTAAAGAQHAEFGPWAADGIASPSASYTEIVPVNADLEIFPPRTDEVSPPTAPAGAEVKIVGDHFTGVSKVTFGGEEVPFTIDSDTGLRATVPANRAGDLPIVVTGPGGPSEPRAFSYPAAQPPADTTAPVLSALAVSGGRALMTLSEAARVTATLQRAKQGRRKKGRCIVGRKRGKRCLKWKRVGAPRTADLGAGPGSVLLPKLGKGRYRVTVIATDAAGNASAPQRVRFRVR